MRNILFRSLKSKTKRQLYGAAAMLIFTGSWLIRIGWKSWHMIVVGTIPILIGITAFIIAVRRKDESDSIKDGTDYTPSTRQMKLLTICSFLFSIGQVLIRFDEKNWVFDIASALFIIPSFILLIFAAPRKHKPPIMFFLAFIVCLFIYLYFFEL